jgi:DNA-binding GntR family transcriptional regulator
MASSWAEQLAGDREALSSGSRAERTADVLRERIIEGLFRPGERLSEEELSAALNVSRNTLREAFRQLGQEGVLVHEFGRGVFVRTLSTEDVRDIYAMRRILELAAVRNLPNAPAGALDAVRGAVESAEEAAARADWFTVGTANMRFHQAVAELTGSRRVRDVVRRLLAELRLVFVVMADLREFH